MNNEKPKPFKKIDIEPLKKICVAYIEAIHKRERFKDGKHYIYEQAMMCIFGEEVWEWINEQDWDEG